MRLALTVAAVVFPLTAAYAGPFPPSADSAGSDAIPATDPAIMAWATGITLSRGVSNLSDPDSVPVSFGSADRALGPADATPQDSRPVVSLGDGGSAIATFATAITDGPGPDFAVFENGLGDSFLELAFVEVSSNGSDFVRFPSVSLTSTADQVNAFDGLDATDLSNLAGKYAAGFGTPFDLSELTATAAFNPGRVTHIRLVDVVGSIDPSFAQQDSQGNIINDPFPTDFFSGGFDLDAVAALNLVEPGFDAWATAEIANPSQRSREADPDGDGHSNLLEYATGSSPTDSQSVPVSLLATASSALLETRQLSDRTDVDLEIQSSTTLLADHWTTIASSNAGAPYDGSAVTLNGAVTLDRNLVTRVFFRIQVTELASP